MKKSRIETDRGLLGALRRRLAGGRRAEDDASPQDLHRAPKRDATQPLDERQALALARSLCESYGRR